MTESKRECDVSPPPHHAAGGLSLCVSCLLTEDKEDPVGWQAGRNHMCVVVVCVCVYCMCLCTCRVCCCLGM